MRLDLFLSVLVNINLLILYFTQLPLETGHVINDGVK